MIYLGLITSTGSPYESAGKTVEVFVPSTGQHCTLPDLSMGRHDQTMEKMVLCGGVGSGRSGSDSTSCLICCLTLTDAGWETTTTLPESR